jgi:NADH-quinone oxidoreductase subunit J
MTSSLLAATIPDAITFVVAAVICVVGALGVVLARNPVHSALMLVMTLFGVAVLFIEENAQFLAAVQVIVYAGAIVVLFLFVIMLLGVDRSEVIAKEPLPGQRPVAICLGVLGLAEVLLLAHGKWSTGAHSVSGTLGSPASNVQQIGKSIFTTYLLAFEVTSALLVVAVVGAVVLARRPRSSQGQLEPPGGAALELDDAIDSGPEASKAEPIDVTTRDGEPAGDGTVVDSEDEIAESEVTSP